MTNSSNWFGVVCTASEVVTMILSNNNLTGTLPPSLRMLTKLSYVLLNGNHIRGTLPASYASYERPTSSHGSASKIPLSPKVARIQSVGDALELSSSSFELERANAQFWDASGTARVLK
ncbi:GP46-like surface antigen, putative [Bodo saltans]|uniref:GP46-like surface antigen, putative n=1 Tax=Bodo saltans TaxID=75058 RepID=A0A0S4IWU0_BODSA|nr:GP46-like surface antigen, putative [Bodo saltans]|eukprot:CUG06492.1 GP46-like surface antigen, putative [Bodo saltans]